MFVVNKFKDRDSIVNLQAETVEQIIDDHHILEIAVLDDPEILDEEPILGLHAVLSGEHVGDVLVLWINVIDDGICIVLGRGREDDDLVDLANIQEELLQVRPEGDEVLVKMNSHSERQTD